MPENTLNMARGVIATAVIAIASGFGTVAAAPADATLATAGETAPPVVEHAPPAGFLERDTLTGDWGGARTWLKDRGITLKPRLTQFYQGLAAGDGDGQHEFEYGGKADLLLNADLGKLGFWDGLSLTTHYEYNFGNSINGYGGTLIPVNAALMFPGMRGPDSNDLSSFYFTQAFGDSVSLKLGKINLVDLYASKPFQGGGGYDSFWNLTFAAPPSGTVPAYLLGALLSVKTQPATFGLWIYDPTSVVNKSVFDKPFHDGVTVRGSVEIPVTIAGRLGHQGFVLTYSTKNGTDLDSLGGIILPPETQRALGTKPNRFYFGYSFNQYLYQSQSNSKEGVGLFGQFGVSDGNPNPLHRSVFFGLGGTGLIPGRSPDNWGIGYYYDAIANGLKDLPPPNPTLRDEQGAEIFYNFALTPWLTLGADLQAIAPSRASQAAVLPGLRTVVRF